MDLCEAVGATYRQVDYWVRVGLLQVARPVEGSGMYREFDANETRVAQVVGALYDLGVRGDLVREVAAQTRTGGNVIQVGNVAIEVTDVAVVVKVAIRRGRVPSPPRSLRA